MSEELKLCIIVCEIKHLFDVVPESIRYNLKQNLWYVSFGKNNRMSSGLEVKRGLFLFFHIDVILAFYFNVCNNSIGDNMKERI